jgi:hypothetical protein
VLKTSDDPVTQCWTLSILSNCAATRESRERQTVAVPALCALVMSPVPEVQHAASLHLATLSHSANVQAAFGENQRALRTLHDIEGKTSKALSSPGKRSLQQEASQYARWALRTAQGRNYKPLYVPKSEEQLALEASVAIQARVRSSFVANQYRKEMAQRKVAATILQAGHRSHTARKELAAEMMVQAPAAALLQGVMRGRQQRKRDLVERRRLEQENNLAATRVQARVRGSRARDGVRQQRAETSTGGGAVAADAGGEAEADAEAVSFNIEIQCSDGSLSLPFAIGARRQLPNAASSSVSAHARTTASCADVALPLI